MHRGSLLTVVVGLAVLSGCGGGRAVELTPSSEVPVGSRWNAILATPAGMAGALQVRGTGWMAASENTTETIAEIRIENATPGGKHPWHVHRGRCGSDRGVLGEADRYELLEVNGDGRASETATLELPVPSGGEYMINVHASPENLGTIIACGNLAPPSR